LIRPEATITTLQFVKGIIWEITQCDLVDPAMTYGTRVFGKQCTELLQILIANKQPQ